MCILGWTRLVDDSETTDALYLIQLLLTILLCRSGCCGLHFKRGFASAILERKMLLRRLHRTIRLLPRGFTRRLRHAFCCLDVDWDSIVERLLANIGTDVLLPPTLAVFDGARSRSCLDLIDLIHQFLLFYLKFQLFQSLLLLLLKGFRQVRVLQRIKHLMHDRLLNDHRVKHVMQGIRCLR
jgi:hypothetical protein